MRRLISIALAGAMTVPTVAFAADTSSALPSGKPAGVKQAELASNGMLVVFGLAIVAGGIALVCSEGSGNNITNSTSSTTSTTSTSTGTSP